MPSRSFRLYMYTNYHGIVGISCGFEFSSSYNSHWDMRLRQHDCSHGVFLFCLIISINILQSACTRIFQPSMYLIIKTSLFLIIIICTTYVLLCGCLLLKTIYTVVCVSLMRISFKSMRCHTHTHPQIDTAGERRRRRIIRKVKFISCAVEHLIRAN